jgi:hypothetical protein
MGNAFSKVFGGNLIPTARVDKNGRVVTRHMKPEDSGAGGTKQLIPSPVQQAPANTELLRSDVAALLMDRTNVTASDRRREHSLMVKAMEHFSAETLRGIKELDRATGDNTAYHVQLEVRGTNPSEDYVRDLLQLSEHTHERGITSGQAVRSLARYENLCPLGEGGSYPEERYRQATSLLDASTAIMRLLVANRVDDSVINFESLRGQHSVTPRIADDRLVQLIMDATESECEQIVSIINERHIVDPDIIAELMAANETSSLSSGLL